MKSYLEQASKAYYEGQPFLSNEEYDALEAIHGQVLAGTGDIPHAYRMYSLKKHYDKDGNLPLAKVDCVQTPKLDGAAVSILYVDGEFVHMLTRGNGIVGRDITNKAQHLNIPEIINLGGIVQITGEVVASSDMENSRNYASGALNQKDLSIYFEKVEEGNMKFVAYNVQIEQDRWGIGSSYSEDMHTLDSLGLNTILDRPWDEVYPTDGIVYRLGNNTAFNGQGFTDKFPRGAIAWKEEQESVQTIILDVEWNTGKSGKVTPVAILEPVVIGEATVARATLNNQAYIEALDLEIGCTVEVIRSGEIIPKIIGRVY
jgi:DNA ligase (NAD+)